MVVLIVESLNQKGRKKADAPFFHITSHKYNCSTIVLYFVLLEIFVFFPIFFFCFHLDSHIFLPLPPFSLFILVYHSVLVIRMN